MLEGDILDERLKQNLLFNGEMYEVNIITRSLNNRATESNDI